MGRGGSRAGAGRKGGSRNAKTLALAEKALKDGITPLEVMLKAMRSLHDAGRLTDAAAIAKDAAPYMHPRLASMEHKGNGGGPLKVEIVRFCAAAQ